jgi:hypothetical protein
VLLAVSCKKISHLSEAILYQAPSSGRLSDDTLVAVEFVAKNIGKISFAVFCYMAVFDVVGVVLCFLLDVIDEGNTGVYYALWFVLAVFCGMLSYSTAADMASPKTPENAGKAGLLAIFATVVIIAAVGTASYMIWWRYGADDSSFVPDSEPFSLTFFLTVLASCVFAHKALGPAPSKGPAPPHARRR